MDLEAWATGGVALAVVMGLRRFQLRGAGDLTVDGARFVLVTDVTALRDLFAATASGRNVLFLHDPGCPISARARREMARVGGDLPMVDVRRSHDVRDAVETATGIRHESPQVLVLADGRVTWSASHHAITAAAVRRALAATGPVPGADAEEGSGAG